MTLECEGCGHAVTPTAQMPWCFRCPNQVEGDDIDHVLVPSFTPEALPRAREGENPFVVWRERTLAYQLYMAYGPGEPAERDAAFVALVEGLDASVRAVDGVGFTVTPLLAAPKLAQTVGVRQIWLKDETHSVGGSHKARHLMGLAIYVAVVEAIGWVESVPVFAIASCGNAALAAAVVAKAADRPLQVFIPADANAAVVARLTELDAQIVVCERTPETVGDPCYTAFLAAVDAGALPFCCQGPAAGLTLEGMHPLAYEISCQLEKPVDHVLVHVGGGALGSGLARGLNESVQTGLLGKMPRFHTVQTAGAAPLDRAWARTAPMTGTVQENMAEARRSRSRFMWPWETPPQSIAHGILDDETYDWARLVEAMLAHDGRAAVVSESQLFRSRTLFNTQTSLTPSYTGAAGLAGVLELVREEVIAPDETVLLLVTGVQR